MTPETVKKLEEAFSLGCSDVEACLFADITKQTLYNYQDKNPEFVDRKAMLKENPVLLARTTVVRDLKNDSDLALKFLERKCKNEFSTKTVQDQNHGIQEGNPIEEVLKNIDGLTAGLPINNTHKGENNG